MARSNEPLFWAPFSGGMMLDALFVPALVIITGLLVPAGLVEAESLRGLLDSPIARVLVFALVALTLFHAAHRVRFTLIDLGMKFLKGPAGLLLYLAALGGSALAAGAMFGPASVCAGLLAACGIEGPAP